MVLPIVVFYLVFSYVPMYGIILAFKEFNFKSIISSPWVGFMNFRDIFSDADFWTAFKNTFIISAGRLVFEFPIPIITALLLNEISKSRLKKFYQTVFTFPHFLSWVLISGILVSLFSDSGSVNQIISAFGVEKISLLTNPVSFKALIFVTDIWKEMGYSAIIYIAAISGINPELYEAAYADGANRLQQLRAVTWPALRGTIAILLILQVGNMANAGFDQILNMYNPAVYDVSDIIDTYIYRRTFITGATFGSSSAVGLFKSVINALLLYSANFITRLLGEEGLI